MPISISLAPSGKLQAEIPHEEGSHTIILPPGEEVATIKRILLAQSRTAPSERKLGTSSAPTQQEIDHLQRHAQFPDPRCPFCTKVALPSRRARLVYARDLGEGVVVRKFAPKGRKLAKKPANPNLTLEDLGL